LMCTLLYPHRTSNLVNREHPLSLSMVCGIKGDTF
jgi:hypothetical protein